MIHVVCPEVRKLAARFWLRFYCEVVPPLAELLFLRLERSFCRLLPRDALRFALPVVAGE